MEGIRLVAVDLDGTLLRSDGTISRFSRQVIREASEAGLHVVIATGRARDITERVVAWLGLRTPIICCNGARVFSGKASGSKRRDLWAFVPMGEEVVLGVISILREMDVYFHVHLEDVVAVEARNLGRIPRGHLSVRRLLWTKLGGCTTVRPRVIRDGSVEKYASIIPKMCADGPEEAIAELERTIACRFADKLQYVRTGKTFLEMMSKSANKGDALAQVASRMNLSMSQVAAIGDGDNDIEMIKKAGLGVAVANGSPRLYVEASDIAFANDDDGPARFIEELLRNGKLGLPTASPVSGIRRSPDLPEEM